MQNCQHSANGIRHVFFLALLGVGVVFLSGPIIAVASVVLSIVLTVGLVVLAFALIGLVAWAPFYVVYAGREAAGEKMGNMGRAVGGTLRRLALIGGKAVTLPVRFAARLFRGGLHVTKVTGKFVGEVAIIGLSGAALGAIVGFAMSAMNHQSPTNSVPLNALVGGGIAATVAAVMALMPKKTAQRRSMVA